jgi:hypothetical protein
MSATRQGADNVGFTANEQFIPGVKAENDLSAKQFYAVEHGTNAREVDVCDGATDLVIGILQNKPTAGQAAQVQCSGFAKVIAGGSISRGNKVGTTNAGKAVAKTADADNFFGIAYEDADDGDIFTVQLTIGAQRAS